MPSQSETPSTKDEKNAPPKLEEPCEVASSSMGLFAPPPPTHQMLSSNNSSPKQSFSRPPRPQSGDLRREKTLVTANKSERQENYHLGVDEEDGTKDCDLDISPTLKNRETAVISNTSGSTESTPLLHDSYLQGLFNGPPSPPNSLKSLGSLNSQDETPKIGEKRKTAPQNLSTQSQTSHRPTRSSLPPIQELASRGSARTLGSSPFGEKAADSTLSRVKKIARNSANGCLQPSFWIGSFMFLLYHIVFCLTMGSTIIRPHGKVIIGVMAKMAAVGIMFGAPVYWCNIGDVPALYPTVDLFTAPILAQIAAAVDETIYNDENISEADVDNFFLGSFGFLASLGVFISGALLVLSSVSKLANLGAYLPFPVISGFFAAVGVLTWTMAVRVDSSGKGIGQILFSGDWSIFQNFLIHHTPSVLIAALMKYAGPKHPAYVVAILLCTIGAFHLVMLVSGRSLDDMIESGWFWSKSDLIYNPDVAIGFGSWLPPAPLGWVNSLIVGEIHWGAVRNGLSMTIALSFLYMIRCSLHAAALIKNIPQLSRVAKPANNSGDKCNSGREQDKSERTRISTFLHRRKFSEFVDIEQKLNALEPTDVDAHAAASESPKPTKHSLKEILLQYAHSQFIGGLVGGFAIAPSVAASPTMYMLGAEHILPQIGSVILLSIFYLTDFVLISYIPKPAFTSLLVLAFIDMMHSWAIKSYFKTSDKLEWLVVPAIVICAFAVGLLNSVFLGIAMSTFLFVAAFFRSGVVKYAANGINIRSNIERSLKTAMWLDQNGDRIQTLVLQNYLFFGNASSILRYVSSMFESLEEDIDVSLLPPFPEIIVVDLTLVTGMDTSAVGVFSDMLAICCSNNCKLFLSGLSPSLRKIMLFGGIKPERTRDRARRKLRFFPDLDMAIGKAEDLLLQLHAVEDKPPRKSGNGFHNALLCIDEEHGAQFAPHLMELEKYTTVVEVEPGNDLYEDYGHDRGLFFIEEGIMKIARSKDAALSRSTRSASSLRIGINDDSLGRVSARSRSIGQEVARMKARVRDKNGMFRVARVGPGWVVGVIEALSGSENPGHAFAVSHCRLHFIAYHKINDIEAESPSLALKLYKLLSYLMAKREETTIWQLGTLHAIMTSPALKAPHRRSYQA